MTEEQRPETSAILSDWQRRYQEHLAAKQEPSIEEVDQVSECQKTEHKASVFAAFRAEFSERKKQAQELFRQQEDDTGVDSQEEEERQAASPKRPAIPGEAWFQALPVLLGTVALMMVAIYFISPLSKNKVVTVTGNQAVTSEAVIASAEIVAEDYAVTTWLHSQYMEKRIADSQDRIESARVTYQFPNHFTIQVTEYQTIAYLQQDGQIYPILSNGTLSSQPLSGDQATVSAMTVNLQDKELLKKFLSQLVQLDSSVIQSIQTIDLQPSQVTADLLSIQTTEGHIVLVPLEEIAKKLPYYTKIAPQLTVASVVDMEVGIFSYPQ